MSRFKVDENLPIEVGELLRAVGHDAQTIVDEEISGVPDGPLADLI